MLEDAVEIGTRAYPRGAREAGRIHCRRAAARCGIIRAGAGNDRDAAAGDA
ncbi:hypothetical protein GLE_5341 [Lysobacter enzymogenes]|uniref:Uncharacterized protein n=1 Tax=Lysobacter enzymogenes TaxID=69 RepID=A0A0S2DQ85_LYSEN|nr:hypothetical protein GLE_5341 [Lysobacter enzymogenes]